MRNKFVPQPYVPNELNLKRRVEPTLPPDQVVDMVKEQPYWRGSMTRPSTWHTPSSLIMGPDPILGSFDARRAHGTQLDAHGFKEHYAGNTSTDINVKEHTTQADEPSQKTMTAPTQSDVPLPTQLQSTAAPLESSASGGSVETSVPEVVRTPRLPSPRPAGTSIPTQGAYQGLRSRGSAHLVEGLVSLHEIENKSVDQLLNGTFEGVREGVTYPEAGAEMEATPSPFLQAYRTSVVKALRQPDGPRKDAVIKAIRDEVQQIIDVGAIAPADFDLLSGEEQKKVIPSHLFVTTKYDAQGNFVREKGRWVAGGNFLDTVAMDVQRSPTVNQSSVMILLSIAATARYEILTGDIKGAYLYTSIKEDEPQIYM